MLPTSLSGVFIVGESDSTRGTWLAPSLDGDTPLLEPGEKSLLELGVGEVAAWLTGNSTGQALWTLGVGTERFSKDFVWESARLSITSQRLVWSRRVESDVWELGHMRFEWVDFVEWSETKLAVAAWLPDPGPQGASDLTLMLEMVDPSAASAVGSWLVSLVQNYRRGRVGTLRVRPPSAWNNPPQVQEDESAVMVDLRGAAPLGGFYVREKRKQLGAQTQGLPAGFPGTPLLDAEPRSIDTPPSVAALAASQPPKRIAGSLVRGPAFTPVTLCRHDDPSPGVYPRTYADGDRIAGRPDDGDV